MATVRYFAAAAEAAGTESEQINADDLGALLDELIRIHGPGLAEVLPRCSILYDGQYVTDRSLALPHDAVLDVLPPFAGG